MQYNNISEAKITMEITPEKMAILLQDIASSYNTKLKKLNDIEKKWQDEMYVSITLNQYMIDKSTTPGYDEFLGTMGVKKETSKAKRYRLQWEKLKREVLELYSAFAEAEKICQDEGIIEEVKEILTTLKNETT